MKPTKILPLLLLVAILPLSCTAQDPAPPSFDLEPARKDIYLLPDRSASCPRVPTLPPPRLDFYPNPTAYALQPFRGQCPGASLVTATGGAGTAAPATVGASGKFCIEVKLLPDAANTVQFQCVDARGCVSTPTKVLIYHKTSATQDAGITSPINLARKQPVSLSNKTTLDKGPLSYVNDGLAQSSVEVSISDWTSACDKCGIILVDLGKAYTVSKLKVVWGPNAAKNYGQCYTILLSAKSAPAMPDCQKANPDWKVAHMETSGISQPKAQVINPVQARWAALLLYENWATNLLSETFDVAEFEVWGQDPGASPPPPPDRCK